MGATSAPTLTITQLLLSAQRALNVQHTGCVLVSWSVPTHLNNRWLVRLLSRTWQ